MPPDSSLAPAARRALPVVSHVRSILTRSGYGLPAHAHLVLLQTGEVHLRDREGQSIASAEGPRLLWRIARPREELVAEAGTRGSLVAIPELALLRAIPATPLGEQMQRTLGRTLSLPLEDAGPLFTLVEGLAEERARGEPGGEAAAEHLLSLLLIRLWRIARADLVAHPRAQQGLAEGFVILAAQHAREHWRVEDYAETLGVTRGKLGSAVRRTTGLSPKSYLQRELIREACELLANTSMPAGQIAFRLGFSDPAYFTRAFGTHMGMPPARYRRAAAERRVTPPSSFAAWP
ncbi:helix-turn-helix transcriptional regulator [Pseudooceanicola sp. LIPI14-2-Ac024]|uniref:helix-turn-helix transcriptional regulator n=1 Tax=Pseudooceanicola sp. LIPI14-2-Ac024 TaxID=3344875 RepID=UPI0035D0E5C9